MLLISDSNDSTIFCLVLFELCNDSTCCCCRLFSSMSNTTWEFKRCFSPSKASTPCSSLSIRSRKSFIFRDLYSISKTLFWISSVILPTFALRCSVSALASFAWISKVAYFFFCSSASALSRDIVLVSSCCASSACICALRNSSSNCLIRTNCLFCASACAASLAFRFQI